MADIRELIEQAITMFGTEAKLAAAAGVSQAAINEAKHRGKAGHKLATGIDRATDGRIPRSALRPDIWDKEGVT
jgi:DNA-binding transcriptional regulator YdaS (Cro superfamily)